MGAKEVNDLHKLHDQIRAITIKEKDPRTASMALMVVLAEVIGASFEGDVEDIIQHLRTLIAEAKATYDSERAKA